MTSSAATPGLSSGSTKKWGELPADKYVLEFTDCSDTIGAGFGGEPPKPQWRLRCEVPAPFRDKIDTSELEDGFEQSYVVSIWVNRTWGFADSVTGEWKHSSASTLLTNALGPKVSERDLEPFLRASHKMSGDILLKMQLEAVVKNKTKKVFDEATGKTVEKRVATLRATDTSYLPDMVEKNRAAFHAFLKDFDAGAYAQVFPNGIEPLTNKPVKKAATAVTADADKMPWDN